jgi:hypothetical protein
MCQNTRASRTNSIVSKYLRFDPWWLQIKAGQMQLKEAYPAIYQIGSAVDQFRN